MEKRILRYRHYMDVLLKELDKKNDKSKLKKILLAIPIENGKNY